MIRQDGTSLNDDAMAVTVTALGHIVVGGFASAAYSGYDASDNCFDIMAVKLDATNGDETWRYQVRPVRGGGSCLAFQGVGQS